jgi:hypothetical protein
MDNAIMVRWSAIDEDVNVIARGMVYARHVGGGRYREVHPCERAPVLMDGTISAILYQWDAGAIQWLPRMRGILAAMPWPFTITRATADTFCVAWDEDGLFTLQPMTIENMAEVGSVS